MSLPETVLRKLDEQLRISILRLLHGLPGYRARLDMLLVALQSLSHRIEYDRLRSELRWLEDQRLVRLESTASEDEEHDAARLTDRGAAVATGQTTAAGVARLRPDLVV